MVVLSSCSKNNQTELKEKTIAVAVDGLAYKAAQEIKDEVKEIKEFSTLDGAVSSVESKEADLVVMDEFSAAEYIENKRRIEYEEQLSYTSEYCACFIKNNNLVNDFNRVVFDLTEDGTIQEIKDSYKQGDEYYPTLVQLPADAPIITVAVSIVGAPFCELTDTGAVVGIDIDIATLVANRLGCNLEIMVVGVDEAFRLLESNEVDFIISGVMYEAERVAYYDYSLTYFATNYYLLSRK